MSDKEKIVSIKKTKKIIVCTISLIVLIMSFWIILDCFRKTPDTNETLISYKSNPSVDYKVYLKPNKYYESKYLTKNKKYISNIIDYIDISFNYVLTSSKKINANYKYSIDAYIVSQYESNGAVAELWRKSYNLVPIETSNLDNVSRIDLGKNLKINYSKYDNLAKGFKNEYGVMADTNLIINMNINASGKDSDNDNISDSKIITVTIPLNKAVTDITVSGVDSSSRNVTKVVKGTTNINYVLLIPSIVFVFVSAPICFVSFYKLFKITNISQYIVEQKKILSGYSEIIAEVSTVPDLNGFKLSEVRSFDDLINIEEELRVPIIYFEFTDKDESWFVIESGSVAYRYVLRSSTHIDL